MNAAQPMDFAFTRMKYQSSDVKLLSCGLSCLPVSPSCLVIVLIRPALYFFKPVTYWRPVLKIQKQVFDEFISARSYIVAVFRASNQRLGLLTVQPHARG